MSRRSPRPGRDLDFAQAEQQLLVQASAAAVIAQKQTLELQRQIDESQKIAVAEIQQKIAAYFQEYVINIPGNTIASPASYATSMLHKIIANPYVQKEVVLAFFGLANDVNPFNEDNKTPFGVLVGKMAEAISGSDYNSFKSCLEMMKIISSFNSFYRPVIHTPASVVEGVFDWMRRMVKEKHLERNIPNVQGELLTLVDQIQARQLQALASRPRIARPFRQLSEEVIGRQYERLPSQECLPLRSAGYGAVPGWNAPQQAAQDFYHRQSAGERERPGLYVARRSSGLHAQEAVQFELPPVAPRAPMPIRSITEEFSEVYDRTHSSAPSSEMFAVSQDDDVAHERHILPVSSALRMLPRSGDLEEKNARRLGGFKGHPHSIV